MQKVENDFQLRGEPKNKMILNISPTSQFKRIPCEKKLVKKL